MFPEILEAELIEQTPGVRNMVWSGADTVEIRPPFVAGASRESCARTEISIVTNPFAEVALEIEKPVDGTERPPICASTNVAVSTGTVTVAFHVSVATARSFVPAKSNLREQVPLARPETIVLLTMPPVRSHSS